MTIKKELPSNAEVEQWKQLALDSDITLEELGTIAIRRYVSELRRHVKGTLQDFIADKKEGTSSNTPSKASANPIIKVLQAKAECAYTVYCGLIEEAKVQLEAGVDICASCIALVLEGNAILTTMNNGVPNLLTLAIYIIELHEVSLELEYHLNHEIDGEDQLANDGLDDLRMQLEDVLSKEYNPEGGRTISEITTLAKRSTFL